MQKKGDFALENLITMIVSILFGIVVIFVFIGLVFPLFKGQASGTICTVSAFTRDKIIDVVMTVQDAISPITSIVFFPYGMNRMEQDIAGSAFDLGAGAKAGELPPLTYPFLLEGIAKLPLSCPPISISKGAECKPYDRGKFINETANTINDCFTTYGANSLDALIGVEPPNPRICAVIHAYLNDSASFDEIITQAMNTKDWKLGDDEHQLKLFLYCQDSAGNYNDLGNDIDNFEDCDIVNSRVYIMFKDYHKYALYGNNICDNLINDEYASSGFTAMPNRLFDMTEDMIVVCAEKIELVNPQGAC